MPDAPDGVTLPPFLPASPVASPKPAVGAGFNIRALARFLDFGFLFGLGTASGFVVGALLGVLEHFGKISGEWRTGLAAGNSMGIGLLAAFAYHVVCDAVGGASLGKLICGLRTVHADGTPCTLEGALIRDLAFHIDGLFFGLVGWSAMKETTLRQRYGDRWAKTVVVKASEFTANPPRAWWQITLGLFAAIATWLIIIWLDLLLKAFVF